MLYPINMYHYQLEKKNIPNKASTNHSSFCPQRSHPLVATVYIYIATILDHKLKGFMESTGSMRRELTPRPPSFMCLSFL